MDTVILVAATSSGLEGIVKRELQNLGFDNVRASNGKIEFEARLEDIPIANLWLRSADRVRMKLGEFKAQTFDDLFEQTKALPWEDWITVDGKFTVTGKSVKSTLSSVPACQKIVKKAVVERLKEKYKTSWFEETGPEYTIQAALRDDTATLMIDTSGPGLNRRGYRKHAVQASLKETLAAALVQLSFWYPDRLLIDPMCGAGTILIEAALIGKNIAPGLNREFASERWPQIGREVWQDARMEAKAAIRQDVELDIHGSDIDPEAIFASKANAKAAGVHRLISFEQRDIKEMWIDQQYGILISNPPYGVKMGGFEEINLMYISLHKTFKKKTGWSVYVITADKRFPDYFKRAKPDRVRKLFSGGMEVQYYQYYGERPPRE